MTTVEHRPDVEAWIAERQHARTETYDRRATAVSAVRETQAEARTHGKAAHHRERLARVEPVACTNCGRALRNPISRLLKIGPICRRYVGER